MADASTSEGPSQGYLYACQRAELLGLPTPTEAEWLASEERNREREAEEQSGHEDAVAQVTLLRLVNPRLHHTARYPDAISGALIGASESQACGEPFS